MLARADRTGTFTQQWDKENRLITVTGSATGYFVYDGDGNRVKATLNGVTTVYVGTYYEQSGSASKKYYYAGGARLALNDNGTLYWLLTDHLGSTSITANGSGGFSSELRYKPWDETRYAVSQPKAGRRAGRRTGTTSTRRQFTGQITDTEIGLYFYGARMYSPALGRFVSADTIVPDPSNPQSLNRYAYTYNNPLNYTDPTGHAADAGGALCGSACWDAAYQNYLKYQQLADTAGDAYHGFLKEYALAQAAAYYNLSQQDAVQTLIHSENLAAARFANLVTNGYYGRDAAVSAAADSGGLLAMPLMLISGLKELGAPALARGGVASVLKGQAGVEKSIEAAIERGETVLGREVTIDTSGGRTRIDLVTTDGETLRLIEAKNGPTARLSPKSDFSIRSIRD